MTIDGGSDSERADLTPPAEGRQLGAVYLHAHVTGDLSLSQRITDAHPPETLLTALMTAAGAMVSHVADLEHTTAEVVVGAYRDVWIGSASIEALLNG